MVVGTALIALFFIGKIEYAWHRDYITSEYAVTLLQIVYIIISVWLPYYRASMDLRWSGELAAARENDSSMAQQDEGDATLANTPHGLSRFSFRLGKAGASASGGPVGSPVTLVHGETSRAADHGGAGADMDREGDGTVSQLSLPPMAMASAARAPTAASDGDEASQAGGSLIMYVHGSPAFSGAPSAGGTGHGHGHDDHDTKSTHGSMLFTGTGQGGSGAGSILFTDAWMEVSAAQAKALPLSALLQAGAAAGRGVGSSAQHGNGLSESGSFYVSISALDHAALQSLVLPDGGPPLPRPVRALHAVSLLGKAPGSLSAVDLQVAAHNLIYTAGGRAHFAPLLQREFCLENLLFLLDALTYRRYVYGHLKRALQKHASTGATPATGHSAGQLSQLNVSFFKTGGVSEHGHGHGRDGGSSGAIQERARCVSQSDNSTVQLRTLDGKALSTSLVARSPVVLPAGVGTDLEAHSMAQDARQHHGQGHAVETQSQTRDFSLPGEVHSSSSAAAVPHQSPTLLGTTGRRGARQPLHDTVRRHSSDDVGVVSATDRVEYARGPRTTGPGAALPTVEASPGLAGRGGHGVGAADALNHTKAHWLGSALGAAAAAAPVHARASPAAAAGKPGSGSGGAPVQAAESKSAVHASHTTGVHGGQGGTALPAPGTGSTAQHEDRLLRLLPARARASALRYATRLLQRYIDPHAEMCVNLPARTVGRITVEVTGRRPTLTLFFEAEREILSLLVRGPVPRFLVSPGWRAWHVQLQSQVATTTAGTVPHQPSATAVDHSVLPSVPPPGDTAVQQGRKSGGLLGWASRVLRV